MTIQKDSVVTWLSGCRTFIRYLQYLFFKYWRFSISCTTCIVYQYFKDLVSCASVWKAGAKIKTFSIYFQIFRKFFFKTLFRSDLTHGLSCEREKSDSEKSKSFSVQFLNLCGSLLSESGCKSTPFFSTSKIFNDFFSFIFYTKTITGWLNDVNKEKNWKQQNEKGKWVYIIIISYTGWTQKDI